MHDAVMFRYVLRELAKPVRHRQSSANVREQLQGSVFVTVMLWQQRRRCGGFAEIVRQHGEAHRFRRRQMYRRAQREQRMNAAVDLGMPAFGLGHAE